MRHSVRLGREAAAKARKPDDVKKAALAAAAKAGGGEIHFARFEANGQQFALSTRLVIDVEWLPNRVPDKVIRRVEKAKR